MDYSSKAVPDLKRDLAILRVLIEGERRALDTTLAGPLRRGRETRLSDLLLQAGDIRYWIKIKGGTG